MTAINLDGQALRVTGEQVLVADGRGPATKAGDAPGTRQATWGDLLVQVLSTRMPGDEALSFVEQNRLGRLARIVQKGGDLSFKAETIADLKRRIGKSTYPSDLVLSLCELLDPSECGGADNF
jgi:hypothetical protein